MKKWMLLTVLTISSLLANHALGVELEKWTYDGNMWIPLGNVPSSTGTGSYFGNTTDLFLSELGNGSAVIANFSAPPPSYSAGVSFPSYKGSTSGGYKISFDITEASFGATGAGKAQVGWGLQSTASTTDDCKVLFQYNNGEFQLVAHDAEGMRTPVTIATNTLLNNINISMIFNLDLKGELGSFRIYYTVGSNEQAEILPGELAIHEDFQIDEFIMEAQITSPGFSWGENDYVFFDNLLLESLSLAPSLSFIQENISFIQTNGVIPNTPNITYEPGDVLQIITTNINDGPVSVTDVSTTLYADPIAFNIFPSTFEFETLNPSETYTTTSTVTILNGATNGLNEFTVINTINASSADPIVFKETF